MGEGGKTTLIFDNNVVGGVAALLVAVQRCWRRCWLALGCSGGAAPCMGPCGWGSGVVGRVWLVVVLGLEMSRGWKAVACGRRDAWAGKRPGREILTYFVLV